MFFNLVRDNSTQEEGKNKRAQVTLLKNIMKITKDRNVVDYKLQHIFFWMELQPIFIRENLK